MDEIEVFPVTALDLRYEPQLWPYAVANRHEIDRHFAEKQRANPALWNGTVLLMRGWAREGSLFRGTYAEADFASFLTWRDHGFPDASAFNCFGMAALRSSDGAYLLGEMAAHTANPGRIYFPAGTPDPHDVIDGKVDLANNVARELKEETGLDGRDVAFSDDWICVRVGQRLGMMREVLAREPADDLRARILAHLPNDPHQELVDIHIVRDLNDLDEQRMPPWITTYFRFLWS
jgi:8-oxo-dGTP pyrophosphatase MutT (NUDIX family)